MEFPGFELCSDCYKNRDSFLECLGARNKRQWYHPVKGEVTSTGLVV